MATSTPLPSRTPEETDNPGQEEFDKLVEQQFSPGDELMMENAPWKAPLKTIWHPISKNLLN